MERMIPHKKLMPGIYQGTPEPTDQKKDEAPRLIRTMKMDTGEAIRNQNETEVSIAIAEEKKRAIRRAESEVQKPPEISAPPAPKPIGRSVVVLILLLIVTLLGLGYVYLLPKLKTIPLPKISFPSFSFGKTEPAPIVTHPATPLLSPSLISAQSEVKFNISSQTVSPVLLEISSEIRQGLAQGEIKNLYFEESVSGVGSPVSANRLFVFLKASVPEIFTRSLEKPFMIGLLGEKGSSATPFIILKVSSYEAGLAGMLEWESTLPNFFGALFGMRSGGSPLPVKKFRDIVVLGKDARILENTSSGTIVYAFANQNTIVVVGSRTALEHLLPIATKN